MIQLTCDQLKEKYDALKTLQKELLLQFQELSKETGNYKEKADALRGVKDLKEKIIIETEVLKREVFSPVREFFRILFQEETIKEINDLYQGEILNPNRPRFGELSNLFFISSPESGLTDNTYQLFLRRLALQENKIKDAYHNPPDPSLFFGMLNSCFLNRCLKEKTVLNVENIPPILKDYFVCFLENGTLNIKEGIGNLGRGMRGGTIYINKRKGIFEGGYVGEDMKGGTIYIGPTDSELVLGPKGGTFYVGHQNYGVDLTYFKEGTVLLQDTNDIICPVADSRTLSTRIWHFDESKRKYVNAHNEIRLHTNDAVDMMYFIAFGEGLKIIEDPELINDYTYFEKMRGGILVFKKTPPVIGKEMKGGIVIIEDEDPSITPEEVKKRISPDKTGGFVYLRIFDKEGKKESELIDVERMERV